MLHTRLLFPCVYAGVYGRRPCSPPPPPPSPLSPTPPLTICGGWLPWAEVEVEAGTGLRACSWRNSSHSSLCRSHIFNVHSTSSTYLEGPGLELGERWSLPLQRMDRNLHYPLSGCVLWCVYQEGGSAGYEPFRCGSSSHTLPCSLTHLVSEEVNRVSSHNCGLSREGKVGILLCGQALN